MSKHSPVAVSRRRVLRYAAGASLMGGLARVSTGHPADLEDLPDDLEWQAIGQAQFDLSANAMTDPAADLETDHTAALEADGQVDTQPNVDEASIAESGELPSERRLRLVNAHTWEKLDIVYVTHGIYIDESLHSIDHLMRDHRAGKEHEIDTALLDLLFQLQQSLGADEPVHVLSGYRTPETNAALRKRSNGVARYSLHMEGKAADIYIPGIKTPDLQSAALDIGVGGVGYYQRSGFVHVDTGAVRSWRG